MPAPTKEALTDERKRILIMGTALAVLVVVAFFVLRNYMNPPRPAPNGSNYYTGPRINKARTLMVDDNGKVYGPAPDSMKDSPAQPGGANVSQPNSANPAHPVPPASGTTPGGQ